MRPFVSTVYFQCKNNIILYDWKNQLKNDTNATFYKYLEEWKSWIIEMKISLDDFLDLLRLSTYKLRELDAWVRFPDVLDR